MVYYDTIIGVEVGMLGLVAVKAGIAPFSFNCKVKV